jgi:hypothetical protein
MPFKMDDIRDLMDNFPEIVRIEKNQHAFLFSNLFEGMSKSLKRKEAKRFSFLIFETVNDFGK